VIRYRIGDDPARVVSGEVLSANRPEHDLPTTGVVADGAFYYIANSQLRAFDETGRIFPHEKLKDPIILRVPLRG
jgi:hypothetical protein